MLLTDDILNRGADMQRIKDDIAFLEKMKKLLDEHMDSPDITKLQYLQEMIKDWIDELKELVPMN